MILEISINRFSSDKNSPLVKKNSRVIILLKKRNDARQVIFT